MFKVGDTVMVEDARFGGVWTVKKVNQTTYALEQGARRLRVDKTLCHAAADGPTFVTLDSEPYFTVGELVRYRNDFHVVLRTSSGARGTQVNVAKLGGDNDRYWRVPPRSLERVEVTSEVRTAIARCL
jgi:hypothetical protein